MKHAPPNVERRRRAAGRRRVRAALAAVTACGALAGAVPALAQRVREFVVVKNARENTLRAEGLVVGLNGTGDSPKGATRIFFENYLANYQRVVLGPQDFNTKNIALVSVTAVLPPFAKEGTPLDVRVAALGDAKSLKGGRLLITPLNGPRSDNPRVLAVAQGDLVQGGNSPHPTTAWIPHGAIVEKGGELHPEWIESGDRITLLVERPDFHVAHLIAERLRDEWQSFVFRSRDDAIEYGFAQAVDASSVVLRIPPAYQKEPVGFLSAVLEESLGPEAQHWNEAKVYVNEHTGEYAVTGDAWVMPGHVGTKRFHSVDIREAMPMRDWLQKLTDAFPAAPAAGGAGPAAPAAPVFEAKDIVELILALDRAGMVRGKIAIEK